MGQDEADRESSLPEELRQALHRVEAGDDNPLTDEAHLAYGDPLDTEERVIDGARAAAAPSADLFTTYVPPARAFNMADAPPAEPPPPAPERAAEPAAATAPEIPPPDSQPEASVAAPPEMPADAIPPVADAPEPQPLAEPAAPEAAPTEGALSQSELDALLGGLKAGPDSAAPAAAAPAALPPLAGPAAEGIDLDALLSGLAVTAAGTPAPSDDDLLGAGTLDSILSGADPGKDISVAQDSVDALLAALGDADQPLAPAPAAPAAPAGDADLSQGLIDALLASAAAAPGAAAGVGLENLAAAATAAPPPATPMSKDDLDALLGAAPPPPLLPGDAPPAPEPLPAAAPAAPGFLRRRGLRLAAAAAVGLGAAGLTYALLQQSRERVPTLAEVAQLHGTPIDVAIARAQSFIGLGDYAGAIALLDAAIAQARPSQQRADAEYLRAEALYKGYGGDPYAKEYALAHARIDDAVKNAPQHPRAPEALGWKAALYEAAGLPESAAEVYEALAAHYGDVPGFDAILRSAARNAMAYGGVVKAAQYAQDLLRQFPGSVFAGETRLLLGDAYARAGALDDARTLFVRVAQDLAGTPTAAEAHYRLAKLAYDNGQYDIAKRDIEEYLAHTANTEGNERVLVLLARTQRALGLRDEARKTLEGVIDAFPSAPGTPDAWVELSQVLEESGDRDRALTVAMQAAARFPTHAGALRNSGEMLGLTGNAFGAASALMAADDAGANDPALLLAAGRYYAAAGLPGDARRAFDKLVLDYPRAPQAILANVEAARLMYGDGDLGGAVARLEDARTASQGRPERVYAVEALAHMALDLGIKERAIELAEEWAGLVDDPEPLAACARVLIAAGALDRAQRVAGRIDLARTRDQTAYDLLVAMGGAELEIAPDRGLEHLEAAYRDYPQVRRPEDALLLLEACLAASRPATARRILAELADHVRSEPVDAPLLIDAAIAWGDWLYVRGDWSAAGEAYAQALDAAAQGNPPARGLRQDPAWAEFQRANVLFELADYAGSLERYRTIAAGAAPWAADAQTKANRAELELRLRGVGPVAQVQ